MHRNIERGACLIGGQKPPALRLLTRSSQGAMSDIILQTTRLTKEFKGFTAVSNVNLAVQRGSIHALIGPNGAGKTTCFNLLTKFLEPTSGEIHFNGQDITREAPAQIARRGVIRSFQISAVFPHLTLMENVRVGLQRKLGTAFHFWKSERSLDQLNGRAMALLDEVGLADMAYEVTVNLPYGRKRALEIATTLAMEPELMLLDEPTQGMGHEDVDRVTQLIKKVSAGRTILMVEHNMKVISTIADRITVLQRGAVLAEGNYAEVSSNAQVMEAYMGTTDGQLQGAH
jgi:branched-chain amino acid transport system ATP-binding protein